MTTESPHSETLPPREVCFRAMAAKDPRFDGLFFIAVRSTGIYCRPVCPAAAPKRQNISFYPNAAAATTAGYRPCLRCRPERSPEAHAQAWRPWRAYAVLHLWHLPPDTARTESA